jgi:hypothetical protein
MTNPGDNEKTIAVAAQGIKDEDNSSSPKLRAEDSSSGPGTKRRG